MLPLHFQLLRRYAPWLQMHVFLATECPEHPIVQEIIRKYDVRILPLYATQAGFLDSRRAALEQITSSGLYDYVLPMQEDFLLDREPPQEALARCFDIISGAAIDGKVASVRLMPSPGPSGDPVEHTPFSYVTPAKDHYGFTFQATLWRLDSCLAWYTALSEKLEREWPRTTTRPEKRIQVETRYNFAENPEGQRFFWEVARARGEQHIGWRRAGPWSNAVYLCPWPYRPTAIVKGRLEPWAEELGRREGMPLEPPAV